MVPATPKRLDTAKKWQRLDVLRGVLGTHPQCKKQNLNISPGGAGLQGNRNAWKLKRIKHVAAHPSHEAISAK
jgi:hypothetical protein